MLEIPESQDTCQGELLTGYGTNPRERSKKVAEVEGSGDLKGPLPLDMEMQSFQFCPTGFWSCLSPVVLHSASFPLFWNANIYSVPLLDGSLCLYFDFIGVTVKRLP